MMKIWGRANSSNVQKPLWFCEEAGIEYERIDVGGAFGRTREPFYLAMNPNSLVPTLQEDDGFVLWESNTIARYLADKHQVHNWYPTDPRQRAVVEQWMDWSTSVLAAAITPAFWGLIRTPDEQRDQKAVLASAEKCASAAAILDAQLRDRSYVCGDAPTLADISVGINSYRWLHLPWDRVGFKRPSLPALQAWYERLANRPAYRKVVMIELT